MHLAKRYYDMASEASTDAYIPVKLALAKLSFLHVINWLRRVSNRLLSVLSIYYDVYEINNDTI